MFKCEGLLFFFISKDNVTCCYNLWQSRRHRRLLFVLGEPQKKGKRKHFSFPFDWNFMEDILNKILNKYLKKININSKNSDSIHFPHLLF